MARYRHGCRCQPCKDAAAHRQADYMARRRASAHEALQCSAPDCTSTRKGHGLCTKHLKRKQKADGTWKPSPSDAWDTPARLAKYKTRKATIRGAAPAGANFTVQDLLDRDGRACGICHADILDVRYPDMASASIDHIVPISEAANTRWRTHALPICGATSREAIEPDLRTPLRPQGEYPLDSLHSRSPGVGIISLRSFFRFLERGRDEESNVCSSGGDV